MKTINFSTGSSFFTLKSKSYVYVKRTEFDMGQRPESNTSYVKKIRHIGNKNIYLVQAEDVLVGESIYDRKGYDEAYRIN